MKKCLYTCQGEMLCKRDSETISPPSLNVHERFVDGSNTDKFQKFATYIQQGCYDRVKNVDGGLDFVMGPECSQNITNLLIDKCNINNKKVCVFDKTKASKNMPACDAVDKTIVSKVNESIKVLQPILPTLSPDMFSFDSNGGISHIRNLGDFTDKVNRIFPC